MKRLLLNGMALLGLLGVLSFTVTSPTAVHAACKGPECVIQGAGKSSSSTQTTRDVNSTFKNVTNTLLYITGAVAVVVLIVGGIRYTASNGDSNSVSAAKNTILYAVIGLIVASIAYAIVNFVVGKI